MSHATQDAQVVGKDRDGNVLCVGDPVRVVDHGCFVDYEAVVLPPEVSDTSGRLTYKTDDYHLLVRTGDNLRYAPIDRVSAIFPPLAAQDDENRELARLRTEIEHINASLKLVQDTATNWQASYCIRVARYDALVSDLDVALRTSEPGDFYALRDRVTRALQASTGLTYHQRATEHRITDD